MCPWESAPWVGAGCPPCLTVIVWPCLWHLWPCIALPQQPTLSPFLGTPLPSQGGDRLLPPAPHLLGTLPGSRRVGQAASSPKC